MTDRSASAGERTFGADEFFYSRTDTRGVIACGNPVFYRVSSYAPDQLDGAPHRIIRHPDTPKALFWLLWQTIQSGQPIGFYIKNLAHDGKFYWTFAVVEPIDGGYLSVQMRPQGPLLGAVTAIYPQILAAEAAGASPQESAGLLLMALAAMDFPTYASFHSTAMVAEAQVQAAHCRNESMAATLDQLAGLRDAIGQLVLQNAQLMDLFTSLHLVPTNMRLLASRLEPSGGPITAISDSYKRASAQIIGLLDGLTGGEGHGCGRMTARIDEAAFRLASAAVQDLACAQFRAEAARTRPGAASGAEEAMLGTVVERGATRARAEIAAISALVQSVRRDDEVLMRQVSGLDQIRILGQVESGRNRNQDSGLASVMAQLSGFHDAIHARLDAILTLTGRMRAITRALQEPPHPMSRQVPNAA